LKIFLIFLKNITKSKIFSNFLNLSFIQVSNILLMILIYPILTRIIGLENFGKVMVANALAILLGILVNYGTLQTTIKDIATLKTNNRLLSEIFCNTLAIRFIIFTVVSFILLLFAKLLKEDYLLYILTLPLVFAEVINPMFFFLGIERLTILNITNLVSKIITLGFIVLFIKSGADSNWVNFLMGIALILTNLYAITWAIRRYKLKIILPTGQSQLLILKSNFYVLVNNFAVYLQQSLMLFALQWVGNPLILGAYALCDKVVWSSRLIIISITNSIYPKAAQLYNDNLTKWLSFKSQTRKFIGTLFLIESIILFLFPALIIEILAGERNETAIILLKIMAFVPLIASLNLTNVVEKLLKNDYLFIFKVAALTLILSVISSYFFVQSGNIKLIGYYNLIIELIILFTYELTSKKKKINV